MADQSSWDSNTVTLLVQTTRELKFDWNAIAKKLASEVSHVEITPALCRQQYAKEYSKNAKDDSPVVNPSAVATAAAATAVQPNKAEIWDTFDKMSLEELIDHVNKKEQEMNTRKEAIFQRVLNSLGNSEDVNSQLSDAMTAEIEDVKKKYFDSVQQKEIEKLNKQQMVYDQQEKANIEKERLKLKKRFDADSVDNIGENPLGDVVSPSASSSSAVASALNSSDSAALAQLLGSRELSGSAADKQLFASLVQQSGVAGVPSKEGPAEPAEISTDLESILMGEQFDVLLSEIEKELDSQSQDKVEEEPSELFEVLSMLENAAKQKKKSSAATKANATSTSTTTSSSALTASAEAVNVTSSVEYLSVFGPKHATAAAASSGSGAATKDGQSPAKEVKPTQPKQSQPSSRRMKPVDEQSDSEEDDDDDDDDGDDEAFSSRESSRKSSPVKPPSSVSKTLLTTDSEASKLSAGASYVKKVDSDDSESDSHDDTSAATVETKVKIAAPVVVEKFSVAVPATAPVTVSSDTASKVKSEPVSASFEEEDQQSQSSADVTSQVTGSLVGGSVASGSSRRVKGKLGSIMSNSAAPRASAVKAVAAPSVVLSVPSVEEVPVEEVAHSAAAAAADEKYVESVRTFIKGTTTAAKTGSDVPSVAATTVIATDSSSAAEPAVAVEVPVVAPPLTHCTMEPLTNAPALATLNFADKTGAAPVYQITVAQSRLSSEFNSDVPLALIMQWLFKILRGDENRKPMKICGLQSGTSVVEEGPLLHSTSGRKCIVIIEDSLSEEGGFSVADFNYLCSATSLSSIGVEVCSVDLRMLKEFVSVAAVNDSSGLVNNLPALNNAIVSCESHQYHNAGTFLHDDNIVVSCMKDYVLEEHGLFNYVSDPEVARDGLLYHYFTAAEEGGLRLAGMRLVYLEQKYIDFGNYKMFVSQSVQSFVHTSYEGPRPPLVAVWCFAFYSGVATTKPAVKSIGVGSGNSHSGVQSAVSRSVADTLRTIHGPEDCILAVRTDPLSMRARFGCKSTNSRVRNIFYNIPFAADKIKAELRFWFRDRGNTPVTSGPTLSLLSYHHPKRLLVGITLESTSVAVTADESLMSSRSNNKVLSELQYAVYNAVTDAVNNSANKFTSIQILAKPTFRQHFGSASVNPALCLLIEYESNASSVYLTRMEAALNESVQQATLTVLAANRSNVKSDEWKSEVYLSLTEVKDAHSAVLTQQTGSQLALLETLKVVPESHYRSHEDVGLSDVCIVSIHPKESIQSVQMIDSSVVALIKLMHQFPLTCRVTLIACKTSTSSSTSSADSTEHSTSVLACLRGYQLLENVDHCVACVGEASGVHIRTSKGKKCLSELLLEFNIANVYSEGALRDRAMYVPESAAVPTTGATPVSEAALALFPPGHFVNTAVLLFPIPESSSSGAVAAAPALLSVNGNATLTRNLARVINKLEKENFELIDILVTTDGAISGSLLSQLETENYSEYSYFPVVSNDGATTPTAANPVVKNFVAIVVRKNAALFKLKSLLGPLFSADFALTSYPHSIASLFAGDSGSVAVGATTSVVLFPTLTVSSVHRALSEVFASGNKVVSRSITEHCSLMASLHSLNSTHHHGATDADAVAAAAAGHADDSPEYLATRARSVSAYFESRLLQCSLSHTLTTSPNASTVLAKSSDIAAIIVTHRLIQQNGLGTILEALHREGLSVVNIYVSTVPTSLARTLLDLTGASSLSLKPSLAHLTQGPAVFLGLEGPSHALIRLKSFGAAAKSTTCLWALDSSSGASVAAASATTTNTEWGIVASSSSRLAKDLYAFCFDRIFCCNSVFTLTDAASADSPKQNV